MIRTVRSTHLQTKRPRPQVLTCPILVPRPTLIPHTSPGQTFSRILSFTIILILIWILILILIMMPGLSLTDAHQRMMEWRRENSPMELTLGDLYLVVRFSSGLATAPEHGSNPEDLINATDEALYMAKKAGRDQLQLSGQMMK